MVLEVARLTITTGQEADFERALQEAKGILAASPGFLGAQLHRGIEQRNEYWLLVRWETVEAHTVGFRQSDRFPRWRQLIDPHFATPPEVAHATLVETVEPEN